MVEKDQIPNKKAPSKRPVPRILQGCKEPALLENAESGDRFAASQDAVYLSTWLIGSEIERLIPVINDFIAKIARWADIRDDITHVFLTPQQRELVFAVIIDNDDSYDRVLDEAFQLEQEAFGEDPLLSGVSFVVIRESESNEPYPFIQDQHSRSIYPVPTDAKDD